MKDIYRNKSFWRCLWFWKGRASQHSLLSLIEIWHNSTYKGNISVARITDISKTFDFLPLNLLFAKLSTCDFDYNKIFIWSPEKANKTIISQIIYFLRRISTGVPQESILEALLFDIDLCHSFSTFNIFDIARYEDDVTPEITGKHLESVIVALEKVPNSIFNYVLIVINCKKLKNKRNLMTECM